MLPHNSQLLCRRGSAPADGCRACRRAQSWRSRARSIGVGGRRNCPARGATGGLRRGRGGAVGAQAAVARAQVRGGAPGVLREEPDYTDVYLLEAEINGAHADVEELSKRSCCTNAARRDQRTVMVKYSITVRKKVGEGGGQRGANVCLNETTTPKGIQVQRPSGPKGVVAARMARKVWPTRWRGRHSCGSVRRRGRVEDAARCRSV